MVRLVRQVDPAGELFHPRAQARGPFAAGVSKLRFKVFARFAYAAGFLWTLAFTLMGYFLGHEPVRTGPHVNFLIFAGIVLLFIALYLYVQEKTDAARQGNG